MKISRNNELNLSLEKKRIVTERLCSKNMFLFPPVPRDPSDSPNDSLRWPTPQFENHSWADLLFNGQPEGILGLSVLCQHWREELMYCSQLSSRSADGSVVHIYGLQRTVSGLRGFSVHPNTTSAAPTDQGLLKRETIKAEGRRTQ